jgi:hypothetical protein
MIGTRTSLASAVAAVAALLTVRCGGSAAVHAEPVASPATPPSATLATAPPASPGAAPAAGSVEPKAASHEVGDEAHRLVIAAAACWAGGTWSDALGEEDAMKQKGIEARCSDLERRVWAGAQDKTHYEQLRALETNAVADVVARVDETARADHVDRPTRDALVRLTSVLADEQRELMLARRAGDRVKRDLDHEPEKLNANEVEAVVPLRAHADLEKLLKLDVGPFSHEAHALGLLCALDRLEIARGLPKHLKLYAVAEPFRILFGVSVPNVPADATRKLVPGTWLRFLSDTAAAAGYPVSNEATTPREKDALAWAGMLRGFSEKLKADTDALPADTELAHVLTVAHRRLEAEYDAQVAAQRSLHTSPVMGH